MERHPDETAPSAGERPGGGDAAALAATLAAAAEGDEAAWRRVLELYARRVYALAKSRCGRHDLAEEITQSVFVTVAGKLTTEAYAERGRFESWLFRIAMNRVRDEMRRQRRHAEPVDPAHLRLVGGEDERETGPGGIERSELPAQLQRLREAIGQLSEADREIVELRHHAGLSFKQIADLLGEPMGTLLARHHRALRKLKGLLGTEEDGEDGLGEGKGRRR